MLELIQAVQVGEKTYAHLYLYSPPIIWELLEMVSNLLVLNNFYRKFLCVITNYAALKQEVWVSFLLNSSFR